MTTETDNYGRYMLGHLIDGLEQRYSPDVPSRTGLARLEETEVRHDRADRGAEFVRQDGWMLASMPSREEISPEWR